MKKMTRRERGFTLIEAILVIVVIGVLSAVVAVFIRMPIQGYTDSVARAEVSDTADFALRRMARDLRLALPNSIRIIGNGVGVEFLLTTGGGRYLAVDDGASEPFLDFVNPANVEFTVVGAMPTLSQRIRDTDSVVVYNLGQGFDRADAYQANVAGAMRNIARIAQGGITRDADGNVIRIRLADNPFAAVDPVTPPAGTDPVPPLPSPTQRFQVVSTPVTYYCGPRNGGLALTRHWGYPIAAQAANPPPAGANVALVADRVATCAGIFTYDNSAATQRSGLVILSLSLRPRNDNQAVISLVDQVHVDNTP
jgi:MSHA biogenesis protein MshO